MSTGTISPAPAATRSGADRASFGHLLHAEWTKFRTVRGWVIGMILAALLTVLLGLLTASGSDIGCQSGPNGPPLSGKACLPYVPHGPGGEVVTDSFYFAHQPLTGNGTITARVISFTGQHANLSNGPAHATGQGPNLVPGLMPWSKAGLIIKQNTRQGSAYAAMLVAGDYGVRMQYNYIHDTAGLPGKVTAATPRWLRLTRSGDTITGYDSTDGRHWTEVGVAQLSGLPATVQIGMFATSPSYVQTSTSFGGQSNRGGPSQATGVFDDVRLSGGTSHGNWVGTAVGGGGPAGPIAGVGVNQNAGFKEGDGTLTVTGSGDIAPVTPGGGSMLPTATIDQSLTGAFIGLIVIAVVAAMFFTAEFRRGLIRTTFAANPRRGPVLAAKALVIGGVTFAVGLVACAVAVAVCVPIMRDHGNVVLPVSALTEVRVIVGTAAMLGIAAVFATAIGAMLRRSAAAITIVIVAVVLPFLLNALNVLPSGVGAWVFRLTPAAGLAIEQSIPHYPQVTTAYSPVQGVYPLPPWAGFLVLCCYAAAALAFALVVLRRRDA
jgi:ABC-type transport system involved in multi-copper enzyme maturation permease subunit